MNRARYKYVPVSPDEIERLRQQALATERARLDAALREATSARAAIAYLESQATAPRYTPPTE